jgi:thymidylate synthase
MNKADKYFIENLNSIKNHGTFDRNPRPKWKDGTPAHSKFITSVFEKYDLSKGEFPITTLRNTAIKTGIKEVMWIYQKQTSSLAVAHEMGINWWDEWDVGDGTIGQRYGATVKRYKLMDNLLDGLNKDPFSRRHIIDLYQYHDLNESDGLFPCAFQTIWSVRSLNSEMYLDLTLTSRSNDYIMAGFINKIQYVALQMMVAGHLGYKIGTFSHLTQNIHVYDRHFDAIDEILNRTPLNTQPQIILNENKNFYEYKIDDFVIKDTKDIKKLSQKLEIAI